MADKLLVQVVIGGKKGSAGSGNWGHRGRPGKLGGSIPGKGGGTTSTDPVSKIVNATGFTPVEVSDMVNEIIANTEKSADLRNNTVFKELYDSTVADRMIFRSSADATAVRKQFQQAAIAKQIANKPASTAIAATTTTQDKLANVSRLPDGRYNMRELGQQGLFGIQQIAYRSKPNGPILHKSFRPKAGDDIDYYNKSGDKKYGRVTVVNGPNLSIRDSKTKSIVTLTMVDVKTGQEVQ